MTLPNAITLSRVTGSVSELGKILDPMADSMYRLMVFAAFTQVGWMPAWMLAIFIVRDVGVAYIRNMALRGIVRCGAVQRQGEGRYAGRGADFRRGGGGVQS
jgi:phosphatidylglycerophosphate synthase